MAEIVKHWKYICPVCNRAIEEAYTLDEVREYVGATHDCPECGGLLMIEKDLTCSDFGTQMIKEYAEYRGEKSMIESKEQRYKDFVSNSDYRSFDHEE